MRYRKCPSCKKIIQYDETDMIVRWCSCGTNISSVTEYECIELLQLYEMKEREEVEQKVPSTYALLWKEKDISIPIPDDGTEVFIGRKYQDIWKENGVGGLNISREHLKIYYNNAWLYITNLSKTNGTLVNGENFDTIAPDGKIYIGENDKLVLDGIGKDGIELVIIKNR